jgi:hypothetical protein
MLYIIIDDDVLDPLLYYVLLNEPFSWGYTPSPVIYPKMDLSVLMCQTLTSAS